MAALINRMKGTAIDLSSEFQRRADLWKEEQKSRLIKSMMLNISIPAFYVDATDDDKRDKLLTTEYWRLGGENLSAKTKRNGFVRKIFNHNQ